MYLSLGEKRYAFCLNNFIWNISPSESSNHVVKFCEIHSFWNCQPRRSLLVEISAVKVCNPLYIYLCKYQSLPYSNWTNLEIALVNSIYEGSSLYTNALLWRGRNEQYWW